MLTEAYASGGSLDLKKDKLVADLKVVAADTNDLLNELGNCTAEEFVAARARIEHRLGDAISALRAARVDAARKVCSAANASCDYARDNPWKIVGIAAAGLMTTYLLSRCSSR